MQSTAPMTDNLAIAYLARMAAPHMTDRQLSNAVRIMDSRDTFGRKRSERTLRRSLTPAIMCQLVDPASLDQVDHSPLLSALCEALASAGLSALVPHLMAGMTVRQAAIACGISERTARDQVATIRNNLNEILADL